MKMSDLIAPLQKLQSLLLEEKSVLIRNEGQLLHELVEQKLDLMKQISHVGGPDESRVEYTEEERNVFNRLLQQIRELQETNMLLTRQSLHYTNSLLDALQQAVEPGESYGKDGNRSRETDRRSRIIDQSV